MKAVGICMLFLMAGPLTAKLSKDDVVPALGKTFEEWTGQYAAARPVGGGELEGVNRIPGLSYLRFLLEVEDILRQRREGSAMREEQLDTEALSDSDKKKVLGLRFDSLMERAEELIEPSEREPKTREQERLLRFYESKARRPRSARAKARKELDKILEEEDVDEDDEMEQDEILAKAEKELAEIKRACFGSMPRDGGFELPFESVAPGPAEDLLAKVIKERDTVLKELRVTKDGDDGVNTSEGKKVAVIAGIKVNSENLGVLLDHSSSMTPYLQALRDEITNDFPAAHFRECYGCALTWSMGNLQKAKRDQVVLFMEDLIIVKKVDGLYWFSDLNDAVIPVALRRLSWLRERGRTSVYVLSVGNKPSDELMDEIDSFSKHKMK